MEKEKAKQKITDLVAKYDEVAKGKKEKSYSEEDTINGFILPLFQSLGWDVFEKDEVSSQDHIKGSGRPDYNFRINGITQFYLEAKALKQDLDDPKFANQAINYSWNKGVTYAILTDFEGIKVFNAQRIDKTSLMDKLVFEIKHQDYIKDIETLWLLSKESFKNKGLDAFAEKHGKKEKQVQVSTVIKKLNEDIQWCREKLTESFRICNDKLNIPKDLLDEGVQKLLDRLIFLRVAEDREVEPNILKNLLHQAENSKGYKPFEAMITIFRELDKVYDSNLFTPHTFESWEVWNGGLEEVIKKLYGKKGYYEYNFRDMPADVLGTVYENYLNYKLSQSKKGINVKKDVKKRKEQGIYYTPPFVVDYIVKNALKPVLDNCHSLADLKKIKVLDPACGSGSFLIKALEAIAEKYREFGSSNEHIKREILLENIFGVDLDKQAIEIARLNLLINSLDEKALLPRLDNNIKNGNSLISEKFNWQEEFPEIFAQGGFDVIIGNPPYIKEFVNKSAFDDLHGSPYYQGKMDIWTMFACISVDLMKDGGVMSFIAPNNWVTNAGASIMRDKFLIEGEIKTFLDFGDYKVFEQAGIQTMIYIFQKQKPADKYKMEYLRIGDKNISEDELFVKLFDKKEEIEIEPKKLVGKNITFSSQESGSIFDKIQSKKNFELKDDEISNGIHHHHDRVNNDRKEILGSNFSIGDGIFVLNNLEKDKIKFKEKELEIIKPSYTTEEIGRYYANQKNKEWVIYTDSSFKDSDKIKLYPNIRSHLDKFKEVTTSDNRPYGLHRAKKEKFFIGEKIVALRKCQRPIFSYVDFDSYISATFYIIKTNRVGQKYLTGILNSNLIAFWLRNKGKMQGNNFQLDKEPLVNIPLCVGGKDQQKEIVSLVDKMLSLNKELHETPEHSDKWESLKTEIERTDKKIDGEVYKIYGLTEEEIKIVEGS